MKLIISIIGNVGIQFNIDYTHYQLVDPFTEKPCQSAQNDAYQRFEYYDDETERQRYSSAVHYPRKYVVAVLVRSEQVRRGRTRVGVKFVVSDFAVFVSGEFIALFVGVVLTRVQRNVRSGGSVYFVLRPYERAAESEQRS